MGMPVGALGVHLQANLAVGLVDDTVLLAYVGDCVGSSGYDTGCSGDNG